MLLSFLAGVLLGACVATFVLVAISVYNDFRVGGMDEPD